MAPTHKYRQAALVLIGLGEEIAGEILKSLPDPERSRVLLAIQGLGRMAPGEVDKALLEFHDLLIGGSGKKASLPTDLAQRLAKKFLGDEQAWTQTLSADGFLPAAENLESGDLEVILKMEHPQTIASILSLIPREKAAKILKSLALEVQRSVLERIAKLEPLDEANIAELDEWLSNLSKERGRNQKQKRGGIKFAAEMIAGLESGIQQQILDQVETKSLPLHEQLVESMVRFEHLAQLDQKNMQIFLQAFKSDKLLLTLKIANEEIKQAVFQAMSERARKNLQKDLDDLPKVRASEIETAKQAAANLLRSLIAEGKISLPTNDPMV